MHVILSFLFLTMLFLPLGAYTQNANGFMVNVAINPTQTELHSILYAFNEKKTGVVFSQYPFLNEIKSVHPIVPYLALGNIKPTPAVAYCFSLEFYPNSTTPLKELIDHLTQTQLFRFVEPNHSRKLDASNDPLAPQQYFHQLIKTAQAHSITKGNPALRLGFIDTGVEYTHPDLVGQFYINVGEDLNGNGILDPQDLNGIDDDGNGYIDDVMGYDFTDQQTFLGGGDYLFADPDPLDDNGHGTVVAGVLGAKENNQIGGYGVAPHCKLVPIRAFSANGQGEDDDIARAIVFATLSQVKVLNMSFGDVYPSQMMQAALQFAFQNNVVLVASSGNGTGDLPHYPSDFSEVISVSATAFNPQTNSEFLWMLSSYGHRVALAAPGAGILSTTLNGEYGTFNGTSLSAPMGAAGAALLLSQKDYTPTQIKTLLSTAADDINPPGWDIYTGAGRLNLQKALQLALTAQIKLTHPTQALQPGRLALTGTVIHPLLKHWGLYYQLEDRADWIVIQSQQGYQVFQDTLTDWEIPQDFAPGKYLLRLRVELQNGQTIDDVLSLNYTNIPFILQVRVANIAYDNEIPKLYFAYRSNKPAKHILHYKATDENTYQTLAADKITQNGELIFSPQKFGNYQLYLVSQTDEHRIHYSDTISIPFFEQTITQGNFKIKPYTLPAASFASQTFLYQNQNYIVLSRLDSVASWGAIETYRFEADSFQFISKISAPPILIPQQLQDIDGDGMPELLATVNDTFYIYSWQTDLSWRLRSQNTDLKQYAGLWADFDKDGIAELVTKDTKDYYILKWQNERYTPWVTLSDPSPGYRAATAFRAKLLDFNNDTYPDIVFTDGDGDIILYENRQTAGFHLSSMDTLANVESGSVLLVGNLDDSPEMEIVHLANTSRLRNADNEYEPSYWLLRILRVDANGKWQEITRKYIYNVVSNRFNSAYLANLDADPALELVLTTFPRTYILDFNQATGGYHFAHFVYGTLGFPGISLDFDKNGNNDFSLQNGIETLFLELTPEPLLTFQLNAQVINAQTARLFWDAVPNASTYRIYAARSEKSPETLAFQTNTNNTFVKIDTLVQDSSYYFVIEAYAQNTLLARSTLVQARPHTPNRIENITVVNPNQLLVDFSYAVLDDNNPLSYFKLNNNQSVTQVVQAGTKRLLLQNTKSFLAGINELWIDTLFQDRDLGLLSSAANRVTFTYSPDTTQYLYLKQWRKVNPHTAELVFNLPIADSTLLVSNFSVQPTGFVQDIRPAPDLPTGIWLALEQILLGPYGQTVRIEAKNLVAQNGAPQRNADGDVAIFIENAPNLTDVYVYPNPILTEKAHNGCFFAGLPTGAQVDIFTATTNKVISLQEKDGTGGIHWDLKDETGNKILPGVYLFYVKSGNNESFIGKFSVVGR